MILGAPVRVASCETKITLGRACEFFWTVGLPDSFERLERKILSFGIYSHNGGRNFFSSGTLAGSRGRRKTTSTVLAPFTKGGVEKLLEKGSKPTWQKAVGIPKS